MKVITFNVNGIRACLQKGLLDFISEEDADDSRYPVLREQMTRDGITPLAGFCFLLFVLLYFPCIATIAAIKNETGSWKGYTTLTAWVVSAIVYQVGCLIG